VTLAEAANTELFVMDCGHSNCPGEGEQVAYWGATLELLSQAGVLADSS